ncbi:hypothetical protein HDU67_005050 [Dinochytrium kinnereticum]|nr:hypothetical protein HDU67_005050 [Dinochytrium kinnereticum]
MKAKMKSPQPNRQRRKSLRIVEKREDEKLKLLGITRRRSRRIIETKRKEEDIATSSRHAVKGQKKRTGSSRRMRVIQTPKLENLPAEVLEEILHHLDSKYNFSMTCKRLNVAVKSYDERVRIQQNRRKCILDNALKEHGLQSCPSSEICNDYIRFNMGNVSDIVEELVELIWFVHRINWPDFNMYQVLTACQVLRRKVSVMPRTAPKQFNKGCHS